MWSAILSVILGDMKAVRLFKCFARETMGQGR